MIGWKDILEFQDRFYPGWRTKKPLLLFSTALAGELGELCGVITHLEGGGTNQDEYAYDMVLEEGVDTYIQLVLLMARYGFSEREFKRAYDEKFKKLIQRLEARQDSSLTTTGEEKNG